ncbi:leucine-rich repeat extensin-like protein 3 [Iris pallida]|uniref:Leucine-rich repeat extensin-like protein 3 n=1 Tax=Iris pallida TaxID=29817 RepID=A0AAX6E7Y3_IRIPA|nr:leucine-rich repeat extensin-like protein 3 [Iris pallida]
MRAPATPSSRPAPLAEPRATCRVAPAYALAASRPLFRHALSPVLPSGSNATATR